MSARPLVLPLESGVIGGFLSLEGGDWHFDCRGRRGSELVTTPGPPLLRGGSAASGVATSRWTGVSCTWQDVRTRHHCTTDVPKLVRVESGLAGGGARSWGVRGLSRCMWQVGQTRGVCWGSRVGDPTCQVQEPSGLWRLWGSLGTGCRGQRGLLGAEVGGIWGEGF